MDEIFKAQGEASERPVLPPASTKNQPSAKRLEACRPRPSARRSMRWQRRRPTLGVAPRFLPVTGGLLGQGVNLDRGTAPIRHS
jgi:hypothetical protein